jgi:hypothetical protein
MMLAFLLRNRTTQIRPLLLFFSVGGHFLLLILFLFEIHLLERKAPAPYSVTLVSPPAASSSLGYPGPVFSESGRKRPEEPELTETALVERIPEPVPDSTPKTPPGLKNLNDCLLKKVNDVCPNADLSCIGGYVAYCVRLRRE